MKIPIKTGLMLTCLTVSSFFLATTTSYAGSDNPYVGQYEVLKNPQSPSTRDKVEVVEFFWYGCPHCYYFEKLYLKKWREKQPDYVKFILVPTVWPKDGWAPSAKAFYTAKALGILEKIHSSLLHVVHGSKKRDLVTKDEQTFLNFLKEHGQEYGVKPEELEKFNKEYHSFSVDTEVRRAKEMTKNYDVQGVPVIYVNGTYRLTSEKADGYKNVIKILDYLIEEERQRMGLTSKSNASTNND